MFENQHVIHCQRDMHAELKFLEHYSVNVQALCLKIQELELNVILKRLLNFVLLLLTVSCLSLSPICVFKRCTLRSRTPNVYG